MRIYRPESAEEAVRLRHEIEGSAYLAGGTEVMRLGSSLSSCSALIDISGLGLSGIKEEDGCVVIGAMTTLEEIKNSPLVPDFIRSAAAADASLQLRNAATIGGNFALRRNDSYMISAILAAESEADLMCHEGQKRKSAAAFLEKKECRALLLSFSVKAGRTGEVRRISRASHAHAAVTGAFSEGVYAYAVSGSGIAYGNDKDVWKEIGFASDLTGSAEYKRYLASVLF